MLLSKEIRRNCLKTSLNKRNVPYINFNYIKQNCHNGVLCTTLVLEILLSVDPFGYLRRRGAQLVTQHIAANFVCCARWSEYAELRYRHNVRVTYELMALNRCSRIIVLHATISVVVHQHRLSLFTISRNVSNECLQLAEQIKLIWYNFDLMSKYLRGRSSKLVYLSISATHFFLESLKFSTRDDLVSIT